MLGRIIGTAWVFIFGCAVLLVFFPGLAGVIPHPEYIRFILASVIVISVAYGVIVLYRKGMRHAKRE